MIILGKAKGLAPSHAIIRPKASGSFLSTLSMRFLSLTSFDVQSKGPGVRASHHYPGCHLPRPSLELKLRTNRGGTRTGSQKPGDAAKIQANHILLFRVFTQLGHNKVAELWTCPTKPCHVRAALWVKFVSAFIFHYF
jgi:hypothetical protein